MKLSHIREKKGMQSALNRVDMKLKVEKQRHFLTKRKLDTENHRTRKLSSYAMVVISIKLKMKINFIRFILP